MPNPRKAATYRKQRTELLTALFEKYFSNKMRDDSGFDLEGYPECVASEDQPEYTDIFQ